MSGPGGAGKSFPPEAKLRAHAYLVTALLQVRVPLTEAQPRPESESEVTPPLPGPVPRRQPIKAQTMLEDLNAGQQAAKRWRGSWEKIEGARPED